MAGRRGDPVHARRLRDVGRRGAVRRPEPDGVRDRAAAAAARQADRPHPPEGADRARGAGLRDPRRRAVPDRRGRRVPAVRGGRGVRRPGGGGRGEGGVVPARRDRRGGLPPDVRGGRPDGDGHLPRHGVARPGPMSGSR